MPKEIVIPVKPPAHIEMLEQAPTGMGLATAPKHKFKRKEKKESKSDKAKKF